MDIGHKLTKLSFKSEGCFFGFFFRCVVCGPLWFSSLILSSGHWGTKLSLKNKGVTTARRRNKQRQTHQQQEQEHTKQTTGSAQESPLKGRYCCCHCHNLFENLMFRDRQFTLVSVQKINDLMTHGERLKIKKKQI